MGSDGPGALVSRDSGRPADLRRAVPSFRGHHFPLGTVTSSPSPCSCPLRYIVQRGRYRLCVCQLRGACRVAARHGPRSALPSADALLRGPGTTKGNTFPRLSELVAVQPYTQGRTYIIEGSETLGLCAGAPGGSLSRVGPRPVTACVWCSSLPFSQHRATHTTRNAGGGQSFGTCVCHTNWGGCGSNAGACKHHGGEAGGIEGAVIPRLKWPLAAMVIRPANDTMYNDAGTSVYGWPGALAPLLSVLSLSLRGLKCPTQQVKRMQTQNA